VGTKRLRNYLKTLNMELTTIARACGKQIDHLMRDRGFNQELIDPEDARRGVATGADAIVVSNHGGRQLDGAPSTISALPGIAAAIDGQCELLFDGGIRSGQDIAKALALGARAVLIGKSFLFALAAGGEAGITKALEILRNELKVTLPLTGTSDIGAVGPQILTGS